MNPEETLAVWCAEESKVRERLARTTGYARAEQLDHRSGLETLQAIFAGELPSPPMGDTLGFVPIRIERGRAIFQGTPDSRYYNPLGTVHGGRQVATAEGRIRGPDSKLYAHATTTCLIFDHADIRELSSRVPPFPAA